MTERALGLLFGLILALSGTTARAEDEQRSWYAGRFSMGTGFEYSEGKFGDDAESEFIDVPIAVKYVFEELALTDWDELEFKVSVPYRSIHEPLDSTSEKRFRTSGLANLSIRAAYYFVPDSLNWPTLGILARVEVPTATDESLDSEGTDFGFGIDLEETIRFGRRYPRLSLFGRLAHKIRDDAGPGSRPDTLNASVGFSFRPVRPFGIGLAYDWGGEPGRARSEDRHELSPFLSLRLTKQLRIGPYAVVGLSDDTIDWGGGVGIRLTLRVD